MRRYLRATFESLRYRNYRLFLAGQTASIIGTWMQKVAQVWLVLELTGSGTVLGVTAGLQQLPTLVIGPWGGLLADRRDKRKILLWTQSAAAVPAVLLGVLTATGQVTVWIVMALALALGCIEALDRPARQTFVIEMVGPRDLTNAVALNSIAINGGKVVGPAAAGILIATVGLATCFFVNALSFLAVVAALLFVRTSQLHRADRADRAPGQLRQGIQYVRSEPALLGPILLMTITGLVAYEWTVTIPLLANETFGGDAQTVGAMFTTMGIGAVVGSLAIVATLRPTTNRLIIAGLAFAAVLTATAIAPTLSIALIILFVLGAASITLRVIATSLVQLRAAPAMRGRATSLLTVALGGTTPLGGPLIGWVAESYGARVSVALGGLCTATATLAMLAYLKRHDRVPASSSVESALRAPEWSWNTSDLIVTGTVLDGTRTLPRSMKSKS